MDPVNQKPRSIPILYLAVLGLLFMVGAYFLLSGNKKVEKQVVVEEKKTPVVRLQLKWVPQSQFAGFFAALKKGYYKDEGIDVVVKPGGVGINPVDALIANDADVAIAWTGNVLPAIAKGEDLVNIGQGLQKTGLTMVAKKSSGIEKPEDIKGKKIGYWLGGNEIEPYAFIGKQNLDRDKDVTMISQNFDMNQLLEGEIDLASAMRYNELELVYEAGLKPEELTVFDLDEEGAGMLQDALFVKRAYLMSNKDILVKFLRASIKGWKYAIANPEEAVDMIGMDFTENSVTAKEHQIKSMKIMAELYMAGPAATKGLFYIDPVKLNETVKIAEEYIPEAKGVDVEKIYTQDIWNEAMGL